MDATTKQRLVFAVNGQRFEVCNIDPSTTLLEFLRSQTLLLASLCSSLYV